ncbi:bifunctional folylpolyglutamate synthase/dihydrofolate synthase [Thermoleptolyngbya sichuanensis A183]|uniref:tetrahydrofolate synthase n=1 Tax=Thermoleptolyngbya sichuanensis A183 TaxID=2737172 RepID=A0A6M8B6W3_9CYAN|nr:folylpolyglutamate synthase/dihydrofolate synthase family protein [Thermoleptolyngbya sichuanensis]QKD81882.1 bifunctional folylpolyglutamate synthase/dihydrofolate synthase [Thermoleptolyngbya sichuanensis A183]
MVLDPNLTLPGDSPVLDPVDALLSRFTHFGVELGLERISRLLAALGNPQRQVPVLHIAGSNGKGSVCAYLSAVLMQAGYRVGRYTSPHLEHWCERIWLNGEDISVNALHSLLEEVVAAIDPNYPSPTQFEVVTAAAWLYFARQQVDVAVMEVGLGGRLDATNVCDRPLVSLITSLSREHWQRLGPTLADITGEKAGILKARCPAAIAPQPPEAAAVLQARLHALQCPAIWVQPAVDLGNGWAEWQWDGGLGSEIGNEIDNAPRPKATISYPLPLPGAHQLTNSAVALAALQLLRLRGWAISDADIVAGMARTQWRGRMQWMDWQGHRLLIDGAHNPAGAIALRQYVDQQIEQGDIAPQRWRNRRSSPITWVIGMIGTKDHADVFRALLRPGDRLHLVPVPEHSPVDLEKLAALATEAQPQLARSQQHSDVWPALEAAFSVSEESAPGATQSGDGAPLVVLCGSLYLIGHFLKRCRLTSTKNLA